MIRIEEVGDYRHTVQYSTVERIEEVGEYRHTVHGSRVNSNITVHLYTINEALTLTVAFPSRLRYKKKLLQNFHSTKYYIPYTTGITN